MLPHQLVSPQSTESLQARREASERAAAAFLDARWQEHLSESTRKHRRALLFSALVTIAISLFDLTPNEIAMFKLDLNEITKFSVLILTLDRNGDGAP